MVRWINNTKFSHFITEPSNMRLEMAGNPHQDLKILESLLGPEKKFIKSVACGYSKLEAPDAEINAKVSFQFQPFYP